MVHRSFILRLAGLTAVVALAAIAFVAFQPTHTARADADDVSNLQCSVSPRPLQAGVEETATCTFNYQGNPHTFVATFHFPPFQVDSCTLDNTPIHIGPCP